MPDSLYQLVYCSQNTLDAARLGQRADVDAEIRGILAKSRANNGRDGITGALLFSAGCFAQVLEGSLPAVERTFERIQCDPRHGTVTVLRCAPIAAREFGDWSMAYAGDRSRPREGRYAALTLGEAFAMPGDAGSGTKILDLLRGVVCDEITASAA